MLHNVAKCSGVPNKRVGWNKHVGGKFLRNVINVLDGINMLVGIFGKSYKHVGGKIKGSYGTNKYFLINRQNFQHMNDEISV